MAFDHATGPDGGLVVGFDLDMTLIDSRPGIAAVWDAVAARTGVAIDSELVVSRLGPPLAHEAAQWFPEHEVPRIVDLYRELYPDLAVHPSEHLPGVIDALAAVHRAGGRVLVITAKNGPHARLHLDHLGLEVDELVGGAWAEEKGEVLRERGAAIYVGDHLGDVRAARVAAAVSVAVTTGPYAAEELSAAGADVVLRDLTEFPDWLAAHIAG
ncbi:HAD family hydrolase [Nocardia seriolae]|uniref:Hydrolase n=1 Tax=Nocardia seriolae TaxID=37332 RepID=A0ABC9YUV5_9NOCA|nr:haloacid dehalogenase-like hydrolase [Nocardia seriolae]WKY52247.1 haloacid dehalogenase-like hydrolase [Nocardia seriolae]WNJ59710.1 haloacid dehalogenase-like hydrolase [Nocardia seriolae]BEK84599.1 HAD family hydrolase [Nocardia seriolae]BEK92555.1 HAD family hydrolase [Nocardia seriolae]GAM47368.1 hydrolase [Nocardia seriolae]